MTKKYKIFWIVFVFLFIFATGCDLIQKDSKGGSTEFVKSDSGLVMEFIKNYPGDRYLVSDDTGVKEKISIIIDVRNKGTFPEGQHFDAGKIYISGFDDDIIDMSGIILENIEVNGISPEAIKKFTESHILTLASIFGKSIGETGSVWGGITNNEITSLTDENERKRLADLIDNEKKLKQKEGKTELLAPKFLPAASEVNPLGGFATAEFDGEIVADKITVDQYTPTILATVCYPYATKASPTVCIDPFPFDDRQEKVCNIGTQTLSSQGAPVQVTKIEQEASTKKIQFKIHIKNVGGGDVIQTGNSKNLEGGTLPTLDRCSPLGNGLLDRKDFDRVQLNKVQIGSVDLLKDAQGNFRNPKLCSPFADGSDDIIRLFDGVGFVICTLTVDDLGSIQSAYTTPLNIELEYNYRSTISKQIEISKLKTVG